MTLMRQAKAFLQEMQDYATGPKYRYRHIWKPNQLVIWDSRQVMHRGEYETVRSATVENALRSRGEEGRRVMWHVGTKGERPVALVETLSLLAPLEPAGDCWRVATDRGTATAGAGSTKAARL